LKRVFSSFPTVVVLPGLLVALVVLASLGARRTALAEEGAPPALPPGVAPPAPPAGPNGGAPRLGPRRGGKSGGKGQPGGTEVGAAAADAEAAPRAQPSVEVTVGDQGVSLFAVSADAHEVLTRLGLATGTRLIVDDTVDRKLTLYLTNKTVDEILSEIVATFGLSHAEVNGIHMISEGIPRGPSSYLLSDIDAIRTKYVQARNAKRLLPLFLQEHVQISPEQNAVVLSGPKPVLDKFRQNIEQFDIPAQQIMFDILVVEFTDSGGRDWDSRLGWTNDGLGASTKAVEDSTDPGHLVVHGAGALPNEFNAKLKALISEDKARVRANPSVATISGGRGEIFIGLQRFLQTPVEVAGGRGGESLNFIEAGVNLSLSPVTAAAGEILIDLQQEVSTLGALDPVTRLPDKTVRKASSSVRVRDGETVVIGGLVQTEQRTSRQKIPLLGDLPVLGGLFQSTRRRQVQTELVIFITPRLLSQTGHLPATEETAIRRRFLSPQAGNAPLAAPEAERAK